MVSTYELGHQPLSAATSTAALLAAGHQVRCVDLAVDTLSADDVDWAERVALSVPMHTAMRLALRVADTVRARRPGLPLCFFGLYAGMAGRPDGDLADRRHHRRRVRTRARGLGRGRRPGAGRPTGPFRGPHTGPSTRSPSWAATPAWPSPASNDWSVRWPPAEAARTAVGTARCRSSTTGGSGRWTRTPSWPTSTSWWPPGPAISASPTPTSSTHPTMPAGSWPRCMTAIPDLTFDSTIKVEHLLRSPRRARPSWPQAGCAFVVSAFESVNDRILAVLDKGHTAADMSEAVIALRSHGIEIRPSWLPFTPWTTLDDLVALVDFVVAHDLIANVDPVQYSVRLLVPDGSLLLAEPAMTAHLGGYDPARLGWTWAHPDPVVDHLQVEIAALVEAQVGEDPERTFDQVDGLIRSLRIERTGAPRPGGRFGRSSGRASPAHRAVVLLLRTDRGPTRPASPVRLSGRPLFRRNGGRPRRRSRPRRRRSPRSSRWPRPSCPVARPAGHRSSPRGACRSVAG